MKNVLVIFFVFTCILISAQNNTTVEGDPPCGCDVYLFQPELLDPSDPPTPQSDGSVLVYSEGNLDSFIEFKNGICKRSVIVKSRRIVNEEIFYVQDFMVNDINTLLEKYKELSTICFKGDFVFSETIILKFAKSLKFLDGSILNYDGTAAGISFEGVGSSISGGEIIASEPMSDGLIKIEAEGLSNNNNPFSNVIEDIKLTSTATVTIGTNITGQPSAIDAKQNRAIHLSNTFESLVSHQDHGTNFFTNIINVDIDGFAVGLNLRGWSNAALVRDIRFTNIGAYGLWVSGCVDNSFANLSFTNSLNAIAIRLDNYIDERYNNFQMGGQLISVTNPNERIQLSTSMILGALIDDSANQAEVNFKLDDYLKKKPEGHVFKNYENAPSYYAILEACGLKGDHPFVNEVDISNEEILRFGLKGYILDITEDYDNYVDDELNIKEIYDLSKPPNPTPTSLFDNSFFHPKSGVPITLIKGATCLETSGLTSFFKSPSLNSFSGVNLYVGDNIQVSKLVLLEEREDDEELCQKDGPGPNATCSDPCNYEVNGNSQYAFGFDNDIFLCLPPSISESDPNIQPIDNTECTNSEVLEVIILK